MASLVVAGDTSGSVTLSAPSVSGSTVLTLPTTTGTLVVTGGAQTIEFADGSASAPSITNSGDTNTGIFFPAADTIAFTEGGVESMRIDSSGRVGIGTTTPNIYGVGGSLLTVSSSTNYSLLALAGSSGNGGAIDFGNQTIRHAEIASLNGSVLAFYTNGTDSGTGLTERMRIASAGNVGIGLSSPATILDINGVGRFRRAADNNQYTEISTGGGESSINFVNSGSATYQSLIFNSQNSGSPVERMRIDGSGNLLVGKTAPTTATVGCEMRGNGIMACTRASGPPLSVNRTVDDGDLVSFQQDGTQEGSISVSGTTVSYNGGHLSRWSQLPDNSKDDTILKGTVLTNLDDMCVWVKDGETLPNEQLNKMQVSNVEGDVNVAGVFVNWTFDEECQSEDMNVAMTGDMIIRIAEGVVVQKGDLLMSAGDGTAKPQGDDIRRSKTVAKVTSNHVTCTYEDGSYCVPCVLMAC